MKSWFGSGKRPPSEERIRELEDRLREWNDRFQRIEQSLDRLDTRTTQINIEHIHIHQPVLERMEFRLDALDIDQLSGSLNLGNNFGAKVNPNPAERPGAKASSHERPQAQTQGKAKAQTQAQAKAERQPKQPPEQRETRAQPARAYDKAQPRPRPPSEPTQPQSATPGDAGPSLEHTPYGFRLRRD